MLADSESRISSIVKALIAAPATQALAEELTQEEARRADLRAQRERLDKASRVASLDVARVKRDVRDLVGDVATLLRSNQTPQIRQMLRKVLVGKITCSPIVVDRRWGYRMERHLTACGICWRRTVRAHSVSACSRASG